MGSAILATVAMYVVCVVFGDPSPVRGLQLVPQPEPLCQILAHTSPPRLQWLPFGRASNEAGNQL